MSKLEACVDDKIDVFKIIVIDCENVGKIVEKEKLCVSPWTYLNAFTYMHQVQPIKMLLH